MISMSRDSDGRPRTPVVPVLCVLLLVTAHRPAPADVVVLKRGIRVAGDLLRDDLDGIRIRPNSGGERFFARSEVDEVHRERTGLLGEAYGHALKGRFGKAIECFQRAVLQEGRLERLEDAWAGLALCHSARDEILVATESFFRLLATNRRTLRFSYMPFCRVGSKPEGPLLARLEELEARAQTDAALSAAKTMRASVLISTGQLDAAESLLGELLTNVDVRVNETVRTKWGQLLFARTEYDAGIARLRKETRTMSRWAAPEAYYWLGHCYYAKREFPKAAVAFLRAPLLYQEAVHLASECLYWAGLSCEGMNEWLRATGLYQELVASYPDSALAAKAEERLAVIRRGQ